MERTCRSNKRRKEKKVDSAERRNTIFSEGITALVQRQNGAFEQFILEVYYPSCVDPSDEEIRRNLSPTIFPRL